MANQLQKGDTFVDGQTVNAARLNNLVDLATALEPIISSQTGVTPLSTDYVLLLKTGSPNLLRKALISALPGAGTVTNVSFDAGYPQPTSVFGGSVVTGATDAKIRLSLDPQTPNKVLASPASGPSAAPTFRALVPVDMVVPPVSVAVYLIDFTQGNYFVKILPDPSATRTLTLQNGTIGQSIKVRVDQNPTTGASVLHWTASGSVMWPGGTEPVLTTGASHRDIFEFVCTGTETYFGIRWGANFS